MHATAINDRTWTIFNMSRSSFRRGQSRNRRAAPALVSPPPMPTIPRPHTALRAARPSLRAYINDNYLKLKAGYLFPEIARRVKAFAEAHPDAKIIRLGIGDVTEPLPQ